MNFFLEIGNESEHKVEERHCTLGLLCCRFITENWQRFPVPMDSCVNTPCIYDCIGIMKAKASTALTNKPILLQALSYLMGPTD